MSDEELPSREDREAWIARFGEYRRIPVGRYGPFRLDNEWFRHPTIPEPQERGHILVLEINAKYEMDLAKWDGFYQRSNLPPVEWSLPTREQVLRAARMWLATHSPSRRDTVWVPCYRRRVGPSDGVREMTAGDWYLDAFVRRPRHPMISEKKAYPLLEAAIRDVEQAANATDTAE